MPPQAKFACKPVLAGSVATEAGVSGVCAHYERGEGRVGMEGINRAASSRRHPLMSSSRGPTFCACGGLAVTSCPWWPALFTPDMTMSAGALEQNTKRATRSIALPSTTVLD